MAMKKTGYQRGFTLLEIIMVVAIIGVLATVALPYYKAYQYRAKAAEIVVHLDKIKGALVTLEVSTGKKLGTDIMLYTGCSASTHKPQLRYSVRGGTSASNDRINPDVPGIDESDLFFPNLNLKLQISSGTSRDKNEGEYSVIITRNAAAICTPITPGIPATLSDQVALAAGHIMEPHAKSAPGKPGVTYVRNSAILLLSTR